LQNEKAGYGYASDFYILYCYFTHKPAASGIIRLPENRLKNTSLVLFLMLLGTIKFAESAKWKHKLARSTKQPFL
jgi:hypothetical protein